jgi:hypothetical protein
VDQPAQFQRHIAAVLEQGAARGAQGRRRAGRGGQERVDHRGHGRHLGPAGRVGQGRSQRGALAGHEAAPQAGTGQRGQEFELAPRRAPLGLRHRAGGAGPGVQRVEADGPAGPQRHRPHAPGVGQVAVLALGVDDPGAPAEHRLAPQEALDEGALAPADLAEHHHVGVGHHPLGVQLEGVEDEGTAQQVVADHRAAMAQAGLGDERVGRAQVAGGDLVHGHSGAPVHAKERSRSVSSCP